MRLRIDKILIDEELTSKFYKYEDIDTYIVNQIKNKSKYFLFGSVV